MCNDTSNQIQIYPRNMLWDEHGIVFPVELVCNSELFRSLKTQWGYCKDSNKGNWHSDPRDYPKLTQKMMLNPNKKYFTQQLTSAPLKWCCFLLMLSGPANAIVLIQRLPKNSQMIHASIFHAKRLRASLSKNQQYSANHNNTPSTFASIQIWNCC